MKRIILLLTTVGFIFAPLHSQNSGQQYGSFENRQSIDNLFYAEGSLISVEVHSPGLENNVLQDSPDRDVSIYLPPGYESAPNSYYPVIYLLHGFTRNHRVFFQDEGYGFNLKNMLDTLINKNILTPVIVVSPSVLNRYLGSWYTNSTVTGNWEDFIVQDLIQYMDNNYRSLPTVDSRGITGHSMGGYGTFKLAMKNPDTYAAAYPMSAVCVLEDHVLGYNKSSLLEAMQADQFDGLYWVEQLLIAEAAAFAPDSTVHPFYGQWPVDDSAEVIDMVWQRWLEHDPYTILGAYKNRESKLGALQFDCGKYDAGIFDENVKISLAMTDLGIEHIFLEYEGNHVNKIGERMQFHVLPFFDHHLDHVIPGITRKSASYLEPFESLVVEMDQDGTIYIVPEHTFAVIDSIQKYQIVSLAAFTGSEAVFPLADIESGKYIAYGVDESNNAITIPIPFAVDASKLPPLVSVMQDTVVQGDSIFIKSDKAGHIYLVILGTTPDNMNEDSRIQASAVVSAGNWIGFPSAKLYPMDYLIYAEDDYGFFSDAFQISLVEKTGILNNTSAGINMYPNPANRFLTLEMLKPEQYSIEITSLNGQSVFSSNMEGTCHQIDFSSFRKGTYFITIRSKDIVINRQIIKL